jgi:hypothetical protein
MRISGGAVPAREMEERMFEWKAASATYQTGGTAEVEPFGDHSGAGGGPGKVALYGLTRRGEDSRHGATVRRRVKTGTT